MENIEQTLDAKIDLENSKELLEERGAALGKIVKAIKSGIAANKEILHVIYKRQKRSDSLVLPGDYDIVKETLADIERQEDQLSVYEKKLEENDQLLALVGTQLGEN